MLNGEDATHTTLVVLAFTIILGIVTVGMLYYMEEDVDPGVQILVVEVFGIFLTAVTTVGALQLGKRVRHYTGDGAVVGLIAAILAGVAMLVWFISFKLSVVETS